MPFYESFRERELRERVLLRAMAMQTGIGLSRIIFIAGAGYTSTVLFKNGNLSGILGELKGLLNGESSDSDSDAIANQVNRLATEIRQLASSRPITVMNGNSGNITNMVVPVATVGAIGYVYMWWKGLTFSDLMFVTKKSMANAVSNLTKNLDDVKEVITAAKKHLTKRIDNLDGKLDEQKEVSMSIRNEVTDARVGLSQLSDDLGSLQNMINDVGEFISSLEYKQDLANTGLEYLCGVLEGRRTRRPELLQRQFRLSSNYRGCLPPTEAQASRVLSKNGVLNNL